MKPIRLLAAALVAFACTAGAQTLKPGLWEVTNQMGGASGAQMDSNMAQMQQQMASLPPAQRKAMDEMMAKQGVRVGAGSPGAVGVKLCFTKEMVEKNELPAQQGDCTTTHQSRSGSKMKFGFACTNPTSTGEGEMTYVSPEAYSMKMAVNSQVSGKSEKMNMSGGGKWLSSDCGNVKPITPPVAARTLPPAKTVLPAAK